MDAQSCADQSIQVMKVALSPDIGKIFQISHSETKATLSSNMSVGYPTRTKIAFFLQILMTSFSKSPRIGTPYNKKTITVYCDGYI